MAIQREKVVRIARGFLFLMGAILILGAIGYYFLLGSRSRAVQFAPADSYAFVYIKPDLLQYGRLAGVLQKLRSTGEFLNTAADYVLKDINKEGRLVTLDADVHPWLGDEIALLVASPGDEENALLMIGTEDEYTTRQFMLSLDPEGYAPVRDYNGAMIYDARNGDHSFAVYDGFLLYGTGQAVEKAIDTSQGRIAGLEDNPRYNELMDQLPYSRSITAYFGLDGPSGRVSNDPYTRIASVICKARQINLEGMETVAISAAIVSGSVQFDVICRYPGGSPPLTVDSSIPGEKWDSQPYDKGLFKEFLTPTDTVEAVPKAYSDAVSAFVDNTASMNIGKLSDPGKGVYQLRLNVVFAAKSPQPAAGSSQTY